jgi:hypothetical protein
MCSRASYPDWAPTPCLGGLRLVERSVSGARSRREWLSEQRPRAMLLSLGHVAAAARPEVLLRAER